MAARAQGRGRWLLSGMMIFWTWSSLMMMVRVWAKVNVKRWGSDDYFVAAAFLVSTMDVGASFWAAQRGYGLPLSMIPDSMHSQIAKALFSQQQFYILAMGLCKISATMFLIRLSTSDTHTMPSYAVIVATVVWTVASMLVVCLRGKLDSPWSTMDGSWDMHIRWIAIEILGLIIELMIWTLAFVLVKGIQISWRKRSVILAAFTVRLVLIPIIVARLYYLAPGLNDDPTITNVIPHITTEIALHFSVFSASITSLRPMLRTFHLDYTIDTSGHAKYGTRSGTRSAPRSRNWSRPRSLILLESVSKSSGGTGKQSSNKATISKNKQNIWDMQQIAYTTSSSHGGDAERDLERQQPETTDFVWPDSQDRVVPNGAGGDSGLILQGTVDWMVKYEDNIALAI